MSTPQQPELARSRKQPHQDPDAVASLVEGRSMPASEGRTGPVPPENQPGHRPPHDQDQPDLDAFAARLGVAGDSAGEAGAGGQDGGPAATGLGVGAPGAVERGAASAPGPAAAPSTGGGAARLAPVGRAAVGAGVAALAAIGLRRARRRRTGRGRAT